MRFQCNRCRYRYIKRFAILPIKIDMEIRWLETVYILQKRHYIGDEWHNVEFCTKEEYLEQEFAAPKYNF